MYLLLSLCSVKYRKLHTCHGAFFPFSKSVRKSAKRIWLWLLFVSREGGSKATWCWRNVFAPGLWIKNHFLFINLFFSPSDKLYKQQNMFSWKRRKIQWKLSTVVAWAEKWYFDEVFLFQEMFELASLLFHALCLRFEHIYY